MSARLLGSTAKLTVRQEENGRLVLSGLPEKPPHPAASVIRVEFEEPPKALVERDRAAWLFGQAK